MSCPFHTQPDPFREARERDGVLVNNFQGNDVPMVLRHSEVRAAAKDWQTLSSDAPMRVPIPSEEEVRTVRQLPLEVDPPAQSDYREIAEPFFARAKLPEVIASMETLVAELLDDALTRDVVEIVREFAIPLQSRALAILTNLPDAEARIWIGWGTHVFREGDGTSKGAALETYINQLLDDGMRVPSDSFFSALTRATFQGRPLTREEMMGFCSIMFAGGRDTVINSVSGVIAHLGVTPADFAWLREDQRRIVNASEEFFRVISPVTHLARVATTEIRMPGKHVHPGDLVALCFASANYDANVFDCPEETRLDRKPNPHVAFGFGPHLCLGAAHARLVVRTLLKGLCERVRGIEIIEAREKLEKETSYQRSLAYDRLHVRLLAKG
ncbi:MAG: cytochrome P450 [Verrucomicrobia bacterium]|nr:MAG: cytochrome P450 [Verrucomicrobiota bacterium]